MLPRNNGKQLSGYTVPQTTVSYLFHGAESFSDANSFSASQVILRIFCNPKFHYGIHNCPPPVPILSQLDPVHTPICHFLKIYLNIIIPSTPGSPKQYHFTNMKREDQQDATIRCLLLTSISTCFGHHYARLQENKGPVTTFGVLFWFCWNNTPNVVTGPLFS